MLISGEYISKDIIVVEVNHNGVINQYNYLNLKKRLLDDKNEWYKQAYKEYESEKINYEEYNSSFFE
jgi:hypothetical protein